MQEELEVLLDDQAKAEELLSCASLDLVDGLMRQRRDSLEAARLERLGNFLGSCTMLGLGALIVPALIAQPSPLSSELEWLLLLGALVAALGQLIVAARAERRRTRRCWNLTWRRPGSLSISGDLPQTIYRFMGLVQRVADDRDSLGLPIPATRGARSGMVALGGVLSYLLVEGGFAIFGGLLGAQEREVREWSAFVAVGVAVVTPTAVTWALSELRLKRMRCTLDHIVSLTEKKQARPDLNESLSPTGGYQALFGPELFGGGEAPEVRERAQEEWLSFVRMDAARSVAAVWAHNASTAVLDPGPEPPSSLQRLWISFMAAISVPLAVTLLVGVRPVTFVLAAFVPVLTGLLFPIVTWLLGVVDLYSQGYSPSLWRDVDSAKVRRGA